MDLICGWALKGAQARPLGVGDLCSHSLLLFLFFYIHIFITDIVKWLRQVEARSCLHFQPSPARSTPFRRCHRAMAPGPAPRACVRVRCNCLQTAVATVRGGDKPQAQGRKADGRAWAGQGPGRALAKAMILLGGRAPPARGRETGARGRAGQGPWREKPCLRLWKKFTKRGSTHTPPVVAAPNAYRASGALIENESHQLVPR